jgi:hypothetical protein
MKNKDKLFRVVKEIGLNRKFPDSDRVKEFEKRRLELCESHSEKDDKGNPKIAGKEYKIVDRKKFDEEYRKLEEQYQDAVKEIQESDTKFKAFLDEEVDIDFHVISFNDLPLNMTEQEIQIVSFFLEGEQRTGEDSKKQNKLRIAKEKEEDKDEK